MSDNRQLSLRLYDVLEEVGASEELRLLHQETATAWKILCTQGCRMHNVKIFPHNICGSRFEGSVTPDLASDTDLIICFLEPPVVLDSLNFQQGHSLLMDRNAETKPGYVKLLKLDDGRPLMKTSDNDTNMGSGMYQERFSLHDPALHIQGPAQKGLDEKGVHFLDQVPAYHCADIPDLANEWLSRERRYDWPSAQQLEKMSKMGCLVVGVGHWNSPERELEWRVSFSLQERLLMASLNPVQHKLYILLKMIKTNIIEKRVGSESLTSYHCKTCIFHTVELTPASLWTPDNLINCLMLCLEQLLHWVKNGFCPNYFIPDQNLFDKEGFADKRLTLMKEIQRLLGTSPQFLYGLTSDHVGDMLHDEELQLHRSIIIPKKRDYQLKIKQIFITNILKNYHKLLCYTVGIDVTVLLGTIQMLRIGTITNHTVEQTNAALSYIEPWFHLHTAKTYACKAFSCTEPSAKERLNKLVDDHFRLARKTDLFAVDLARATILYRCGHYDTCRGLLLKIMLTNTGKKMAFHCACTNDWWYTMEDNKANVNVFHDTISPLPVTDILNNNMGTCVIFLRSELEIIPTALQYELFRSIHASPGSRVEQTDFWFDFAVVDAFFYTTFMLYNAISKLQKDARAKMAKEKTISTLHERTKSTHHQHRDTVYNLMGWVFFQEHRVQDALRCFVESWKIRPDHNAAKLHVLCMYAKLAAGQLPN